MKRHSENEKVVLGMDLLAPEGYGEIIGGSERETNLDILLDNLLHLKHHFFLLSLNQGVLDQNDHDLSSQM